MRRLALRFQRLIDLRRHRREPHSNVLVRALSNLEMHNARQDLAASEHDVTADGLRRRRAGVLDLQQALRSEAHARWLRERADGEKQAATPAEETQPPGEHAAPDQPTQDDPWDAIAEPDDADEIATTEANAISGDTT